MYTKITLQGSWTVTRPNMGRTRHQDRGLRLRSFRLSIFSISSKPSFCLVPAYQTHMEERIVSFIQQYNIRDGAFAVVGTTFVPLRYVPRNQPIHNIYVIRDRAFVTKGKEEPRRKINEATMTASMPIPCITRDEKIDDGT